MPETSVHGGNNRAVNEQRLRASQRKIEIDRKASWPISCFSKSGSAQSGVKSLPCTFIMLIL